MEQKKTLVLGASLKPHRFAYKAVIKLIRNNIPVVAVGMREGAIGEVKIEKPFPEVHGIHTITLYVGPKNQQFYLDYILKVNPVRVIFNPGTENPEMEKLLADKGIEVVRRCMLVMLSKGEF
ncbi:MAG: CoA-binding protein [Bacteroidetes bacterium]|nr:CoA-binding protein [Bacteroidota bacterium]